MLYSLINLRSSPSLLTRYKSAGMGTNILMSKLSPEISSAGHASSACEHTSSIVAGVPEPSGHWRLLFCSCRSLSFWNIAS